MIIIKNKREIAIMKEAGRIVALVHDELKKVIKPGISTATINQIAEDIIIKNGAIPSFKGYGGFPAAVCASVNEVLVHGFPTKTPLKEGDIVSIDVGAMYQGYHGDSAWTYAVGAISDEAKTLMDVTEASLFIGLQQAKPGNRLSDISHAIQVYVESFGYSLPEDYAGHGIGTDLHEDPMIPNFGLPGRGPLLKEGMTFAIEPMVHIGKKDTVVLKDGWTVETQDKSLSAHFEHTIVITKEGYEILTILSSEEVIQWQNKMLLK